jgi:hypothetical protein
MRLCATVAVCAQLQTARFRGGVLHRTLRRNKIELASDQRLKGGGSKRSMANKT